MKTLNCVTGISVLVLSEMVSRGEIKIVTAHNPNGTPAFKLEGLPAPAAGDAAAKGKFTIVDGARDEAGGGLEKLNDGKLPTEEDQPAQNFFFDAGTEGGRLRLDLGNATTIRQVNTYSWHTDTRAAQVYKLYGSDGAATNFSASPKRGTDPAARGWKLITSVDTRPKSGDPGGQYGVSISDSAGALGEFRYLLFDCSRTEADDDFGNTFYSEIDVVAAGVSPVAGGETPAPAEGAVTKTFQAADGRYEFTIDATIAPDLMDWAERELRPVVQEWYPKLSELLPSEGFEAPKRVTLVFRDNMAGGIPASAGGGRINLNAGWFRNNTKGEGKGAVVHEMVHIVQRYNRGRRDGTNNAAAARFPGWLVEGIPDYIRWFKYEPEAHGADDIWMKRQNFSRVHYDSSYRITANFLNWASDKYDKDLVMKLNAAARNGTYSEDLWKTCTGKTASELGDEWREQLRQKLGIAAEGGTATNKGT